MYVGYWGTAAIVTVLLSWLFYRYFAPKSWKEWTRAGLVQAFIIAFYAEMYGFPLTIYLLARVFGLDISWTEGGNLWARLFGTEWAHMIAMAVGYAIVVAGVALIAVGWRELYRAQREDRLATDGLYGMIRHPQYTGIFVVIFGEGLVHWPTVVSVAMFPVIVLAYVLLARKEERQMLEKFGDRYRDYQRRVPIFIPRWSDLRQQVWSRSA
ncbi:MAG: isoprenylcysteine carboxylmethyltransferase family protein [Planctomycetes bacterium]|nr:isoprenylcysteine carboxylmethyltransferase family protein [Planctomycetota bacterium]